MMSPSRRQIQPNRVIAQFGHNNDPLFVVEEGIIPGEKEPENAELFVIRDADQALPQRVIAAGEIHDIDPSTGHAHLDLEINDQADEATYELQPGDIRGGLRVLLKDAGIETATINANLSADELRRIGCQATSGAVEFSLPVAA